MTSLPSRDSAVHVDVHRRPGEESIGLYPGLVVSDGDHSRVTGSITVGQSRLPVWAFIHEVVVDGWDATENYYDAEDEREFGCGQAAEFIHALMQHRGELGRLILLLADAERCGPQGAWTGTKRHPKRLADQMRRCLALLDADERDGHA